VNTLGEVPFFRARFEMKSLLHAFAALALLLAAGCATSYPEVTGHPGDAAVCHVCRHNNDLACVCVDVTDKTPRTEYNGKTYYFCSDACREAFLKKPEKYLPKR